MPRARISRVRFRALLATKREVSEDVDAVVRAIIRDVRDDGDAALRRYSEKFDRVDLDRLGLRVTPGELAAAKAACRAEDLAALALAHARIAAFHARQRPEDLRFKDALGRRARLALDGDPGRRPLRAGRHRGLSLVRADERRAGQGGRLRAARHGGACARRPP